VAFKKPSNSFKKIGVINTRRVLIALPRKDFLSVLIVQQEEKEQKVKKLNQNQSSDATN
jgi:hypothetical protein